MKSRRRTLVDPAAGASGGPERGQDGVAPGQVGRPGEVLGVLGVGPWPAALDDVDAEVVEEAGDPQLVGHRELEADLLGVQPSHSAGFDPAGGRQLLSRLYTGSPPIEGVDVWFSTHPPFPERLGQIQKYLDGVATPVPASPLPTASASAGAPPSR